MDLKIFKVFRDDFADKLFEPEKETQSIRKKKNKKNIGLSHESHRVLYSIRDLVKKPSSFFVDKFFFIDCPSDSKQKFKYVHIKMKQLKSINGGNTGF